MTIEIKVVHSEALAKIRQHLSVLGKRAKMVDGTPMFSDFQPSTHEESVYYDLIASGMETLVNNLGDICSSYTTTEDSSTHIPTTTFKLVLTRYEMSEVEKMNVTAALRDACIKYVYNFALAQYLAIIHPGTGEKYPPRWGVTYQEQCAIIIGNIKSIAYNKRPADISDKSYADVKVTTDTDEPDEIEEVMPH